MLSYSSYCSLVKNFLELCFNVDIKYVVCEQLLKNYPIFSYSELIPHNFKQIVVYRDPRDAFFLIQCCPDHNQNQDYELFIRNYLIYYKQYENYFNKNDQKILIVRLEDLIMKYDKYVKIIENFIGLNNTDHNLKFNFFNLQKLSNSIGIYKKFHDNNVMNLIKNNLIDFIYC